MKSRNPKKLNRLYGNLEGSVSKMSTIVETNPQRPEVAEDIAYNTSVGDACSPKRPTSVLSQLMMKWSFPIRNSGFENIAALLPSLCLNEIASVQALDRRVGAVFYLDVQYGSDKGAISSGDTMLSSLTGHARTTGQRQYASTLVKGETTGITETGTATLSYAPGVDVTSNRISHPERAIVIKDADGTVVASDSSAFSGATSDHAGTLKTSGNLSVGTVTAAGALTISGNLDAASTAYTIDYCYQYDLPTNLSGSTEISRKGVPEANIAMAQSTVTALDFPIRSKYSLGAAIDVQRAYEEMGPSYSNVCRKAA